MNISTSPEQDLAPIPLCDLKAQYQTLKDEVGPAMQRVLESCAFIKGPEVVRFESDFAALHGLEADRAVGCSNGTSALTVALKSLELAAGGEVIIPSHTFFATAESVFLAGLVPVFADIRPGDYTLDPKAAAALITDRTVAIVPVHIYGTMADMDALMALAERHSLALIEDTAQAHMACWNGRMAGSIGDAAAFSFYPGKNLGAYGDAGAMLAREAEVADRARCHVDHGRADKYLHEAIGDNQRIDTLQAAVLEVKLRHLSRWSEARRAIAARYDAAFRKAGFKTIEPDLSCTPVYHLYIVEVSNRDEAMAALKAQGIASGVHYPVPVHAQPALTDFGLKSGPLEVTTRIVDRIMSLPIYPEMTDEQVDRVIASFLNVAKA